MNFEFILYLNYDLEFETIQFEEQTMFSEILYSLNHLLYSLNLKINYYIVYFSSHLHHHLYRL